MLHAIAISLLCLQATQPATTPAARSTAVIVGRVIDGGTGKPVSGAVVSLQGATLRVGQAPRLMTDSQGRFLYRNLPPGSYSIVATKPGYIDGAYGRRRPEGGTQPVELSEGERANDIPILIWKYAAIGGTIVDEAGQPIVGAQVRALQRRMIGGREVFRPLGVSLTSDDRGVYRIANLPPGEYTVSVSAQMTTVPGAVLDAYQQSIGSNDASRRALSSAIISLGPGATNPAGPYVTREGDLVVNLPRGLALPNGDGAPRVIYPTTYHPGATSHKQATTVRVASGQERSGIDIQLRPVPASTISGTVLLPDGPAANVAVRLDPPDAARGFMAEGHGTITDGGGRFTLLNIPAGDYTLRVSRLPPTNSPEGISTIIQGAGITVMSSTNTGDGPPAPLPTDPTWWAAVPVQVGRRDITDLNVTLQEGVRFSGRLEFDGVAERPEPDRLRRLVLNIAPADESFLSGSRPAQIEADGSFKTIGLPGGSYIARMTSPLPGWTVESVMYQGRDIADVPIDVSSADIAGIVVTLTDRPAEIAGTVRGSSGPDIDASVLLFPTEPSLWTGTSNARRMRLARVTKTGAYSIKGLPPGSYYLVAVPDEESSDWTDPRSLEALARSATLVDVDRGSQKTQDLRTVRRGRER